MEPKHHCCWQIAMASSCPGETIALKRPMDLYGLSGRILAGKVEYGTGKQRQ